MNIHERSLNLPDYIYGMMEDGERISYFEIFQEENEEELNFEYGSDEEYLIDDQYCIHPGKGNHEAGLAFINFGENKMEPFTEFSVDINLVSLKYKITQESSGEEKVHRVMEYITSSRGDLTTAIRRRYTEAKGIGEELLRRGNPREV